MNRKRRGNGRLFVKYKSCETYGYLILYEHWNVKNVSRSARSFGTYQWTRAVEVAGNA